jgi:urease gamma subunit
MLKYRTDCGHYLDYGDTVNLIRLRVIEQKRKGRKYDEILQYQLIDDSFEGDELEIEKQVKRFFILKT